MVKYKKVIESIGKIFGSEWIKPATQTVIEFAVLDYQEGNIINEDYSEICKLVKEVVNSKNNYSNE